MEQMNQEQNNRHNTKLFRIISMQGEVLPKDIYCRIVEIRDESDTIIIELWDHKEHKLQRTMNVNHIFFDQLEKINNIVYMNNEEFEKFYEIPIVYAEPPLVSRLGDID